MTCATPAALAQALCAGASDVHGAEGHYRQAVALAEELDMRPHVARCHAGLANLYQRTGKHQQARELFSTAMAMYREMDLLPRCRLRGTPAIIRAP